MPYTSGRQNCLSIYGIDFDIKKVKKKQLILLNSQLLAAMATCTIGIQESLEFRYRLDQAIATRVAFCHE